MLMDPVIPEIPDLPDVKKETEEDDDWTANLQMDIKRRLWRIRHRAAAP